MAGKKKSINLLLNDGDLDGVVLIEDSSWVSGAMYAAPRDAVDKLLEYKESSYSGVYFLLSQDKVYVGQASDLKSRIKQHRSRKDWWEQVILLTTKDNSFTHTDIDYLEAHFIKLAQKYHHLDVENKKDETAKVNRFEQIRLDDYIEEATFLLERIMGIFVFSNKNATGDSFVKNHSKAVEKTAKKETKKKTHQQIISKSEALAFLADNGLVVKSRQCTYAKLQPNQSKYWANPKKEMVQEDWDIVLNDTQNHELIHVFIPAKSILAGTEKRVGKLVVRKDKPNQLDINIHSMTFIDMYSQIDMKEYVVTRYKY